MPQSVDSSSLAVPLDSITGRPKKTRAKPKKVVQPNPYPDLSSHPARVEEHANGDISTSRSPTTSSCGTDSIVDTTLLHSLGSPPMLHYPLSIPNDPGFFVLTNAEWHSASQAPNACSYIPTSFSNDRRDRSLCSSNETVEGSLVYPTLIPLDASSSSLTTSADMSCGKRKRVMDDNELVETRNSRKRQAVTTPSSSGQGLYGNHVGAISSTPAHSIYEKADSSGSYGSRHSVQK